MNDYTGLAESLAKRKAGLAVGGGINDLPHYLATAPGRNTVRGAIDAMIAHTKTTGQPVDQPHKTLIEILMRGMNGAQQ